MSNPLIFSGATRNRKSICIALFLNKLYLFHDVSPLNKVFTALHRSTLVCILGTISEYKGNGYLHMNGILSHLILVTVRILGYILCNSSYCF